MQSPEFLRGIFGEEYDGWLAVWCAESRETVWLQCGDVDRVSDVITDSDSWYFGLGLHETPPQTGRGKSADVRWIPGLWADVDCAGKETVKRYPSRDHALDAIGQMPIHPSVIVDTGGGMHVYWLFHEPVDANDELAAIVGGWEALLGQKLKAIGDYDLDAVHDLARVMRLVGSRNNKHKPPHDVQPLGKYMDPDKWDRFAIDDFTPFVGHLPPAAKDVYVVGDLALDDGLNPPLEKHEALLANSPEYRRVWEHKVAFPSCSEYEASLARHAAHALWTDQEICQLVIAHRRKYDPDKIGKVTKRRDYVASLIRMVRDDHQYQTSMRALTTGVEQHEADDDDDQKTDSKKDKKKSEPMDRAGTLDHLSVAFGVRIEAWIQLGREKPLYTLVLAGGKQIRVGGTDEVTSGHRAIRNALYAACGHLMRPKTSKEWNGILGHLARVCTVIEAEEATMSAAVADAISEYLQDTQVAKVRGSERDHCCRRSQPFAADGYVWINLESLRKWCGHRGDRWSRTELVDALRRNSWTTDPVHYTATGGARTTRSYYRHKIGEQLRALIETDEEDTDG